MADAGTLFIVAGVVIAALIVWVLSTRKAPKLPEGKAAGAPAIAGAAGKELAAGPSGSSRTADAKLAAVPASAAAAATSAQSAKTGNNAKNAKNANAKGASGAKEAAPKEAKASAEPAKIDAKATPKADTKAETKVEPTKEAPPSAVVEPAPVVMVEAAVAKAEPAPAAPAPASGAKAEVVAAKSAPAASEPKLPETATSAPKVEAVRAPLRSEPKAEAARAPMKSEPRAAASPVAAAPAAPLASPAASPAPAVVAAGAVGAVGAKTAEKLAPRGDLSAQKVEAARSAAPVEMKKVESVRPPLSSHHEIQDTSIPAAADVPLGTLLFEFTTAAARWQPDAARDSGDAHATLLDEHLFVLAANRNGSKGSAVISALRDAKGSNGWRNVLSSKGADATPTVAAFFPGGSNSVELARIGDGQGYRLRGGTLTRITGDGSAREVERKTVEVDVGDLYILCSAELCRTVPEEEIRELLMLDHDPNNGVRDLLAISGDRAPTADVNVFVVRVDPLGGY